MASENRSLVNESMMAILSRVRESKTPVPRSTVYFSATERDELDYLIGAGMLKRKPYLDPRTGTKKCGLILSDEGERIFLQLYEIILKIGFYKPLPKTIDNPAPIYCYVSGEDPHIKARIEKTIEEAWIDNTEPMEKIILNNIVKKLKDQLDMYIIVEEKIGIVESCKPDITIKKKIDELPSENVSDWYFVEIKKDNRNISEIKARMDFFRKVANIEMKAHKKNGLAAKYREARQDDKKKPQDIPEPMVNPL